MKEKEQMIDLIEANETVGLEEEEVLSQTEINRLAYLAEHPEQADPVFLYVRDGKRSRGGAR
jgi:hypothetical protein